MPAINPQEPRSTPAAPPGVQKSFYITESNTWDQLLLLTRSSDSIQQERQKILAWYRQMQPTGAAPSPAGKSDQRNVIVCLGNAYVSVCKLFGSLAGRRVLYADKYDQLDILPEKKFTSVLFVGEEGQFSKAWQEGVSKTLRVPWGIVSGKTVHDTGFFLAKLLLASGCASAKNLLVNALGRKFSIRNGQQPAVDAGFNKRVLAFLFEREWQHLSLYAHGEISHLLLNSWVLCGGQHAVPGASQAHIDTCEQEGDRRHCMRVHNKSIGIVYLPELKAIHLQLFSCTSLNFSPRLAPANASLFYAVIMGYCSSAIMTNRNVAIREGTVQIAHALRCYGAPAGFVTGLLNDCEAYVHKDKPYILVGDPAGNMRGLVQNWEEGNREIRSTEGIVVYKLPLTYKRQIIGIQGAGETKTIRGTKWVSVYYKQNRQGFLACSSKEEAFQSSTRFLERALECYRVCEHVQENLDALMLQQPRIKRSCQQMGIQLRAGSNNIKQPLDAALAVADNIRLQGVWHQALAEHEKRLRYYLDQWQQDFCSLLNEPVLFAYFGNLLAANTVETSVYLSSACDYCGTALRDYRMLQARRNQVLQKLWCDLCGLRRLAVPAQDPFEVIHSKKLVPGGALLVKVKCSQGSPAETAPIPAHLVVSLYNKSHEKEIARQQLKTTRQEARFLLRIPHSISADLHVLGVVCMRAPYITYYRSRISIMY